MPKKKRSQGSIDFHTAAWHWALHAPEHRVIPNRLRPTASSIAREILRWNFVVPNGFSLTPAQSFRKGIGLEMRIQKSRFARLQRAEARLSATWVGLAHAFPEPFAVRLHLRRGSIKGRFWLLLTADGHPLAFGRRSIDFSVGVVQHEYLAFAPNAQGKGHVAQVMANALAIYERIGVTAIALTAGLSAGSAVWPRFGFAPSDETEWRGLREIVRKNALRLDPDIALIFSSVHGRRLDTAIAAILADDDPLAVFELVDLDPGNQAGNAAGLRFGIAGELLAGGHWRGVLQIGGPGGRRLRAYIDRHGVRGPCFSG